MLALGHAGLTLGAAAVAAHVAVWCGKNGNTAAGRPVRESPFVRLSRRMDIRLLLIGSLLPDIIDKPLGQVILRDVFNNGRIVAHTLLFLLVLVGLGWYLQRSRRNSAVLVLASGNLMHLLEDQMWRSPVTLLYPLYGFTFPAIDLTGWMPGMWYALLHDPSVYVPEAAGLAVLALFAWHTWRSGSVRLFVATGRVKPTASDSSRAR